MSYKVYIFGWLNKRWMAKVGCRRRRKKSKESLAYFVWTFAFRSWWSHPCKTVYIFYTFSTFFLCHCTLIICPLADWMHLCWKCALCFILFHLTTVLFLFCVFWCVCFFYLFLFFIFSLWFCWRYFSAIMGSCVIAKCIRFFKTTDTWWCYKKLQDIHVNKTYAFFCYPCVGWCYKVLKFSCFWNKTRRLKYVPHLFHWLK